MVMKQISVVCFVALFLLTSMLNSLARDQVNNKDGPEPPDTKNGLYLSIEIDGRSFRMSDTPSLKIKLKNISQDPITIYKQLDWGRSSSFSLSISDERGNSVRGVFLSDALHTPPFSKEDFITIQPGQSIERERTIDLQHQGIKAPGAYRIIVWYHSPVPSEFAPQDMEIWPTENGVLQSKPVTFNVTH